MAQRFYFQIGDLPHARGADPDLSFQGQTPGTFAAELQAALRTTALFERWRAKQPEPDDVDPALGAVDPGANVTATDTTPRTDIVVATALPHAILKHRMRLLVGSSWTLSDVK